MVVEWRCDGVKTIHANRYQVHYRRRTAYNIQANPQCIELVISFPIRPLFDKEGEPKRHTYKPNQEIRNSQRHDKIVRNIP